MPRPYCLHDRELQGGPDTVPQFNNVEVIVRAVAPSYGRGNLFTLGVTNVYEAFKTENGEPPTPDTTGRSESDESKHETEGWS